VQIAELRRIAGYSAAPHSSSEVQAIVPEPISPSPLDGGRPSPSQSVLLVCGLLLFWLALIRLSQVLGGDADPSAGTITWTSLVLAAVAAYPARARNSAIATMITAVALGVAVLAAGCGLIAYGAVDRVPGAAWLGVAHLAAFLVVVNAGAEETLLWWPLVLLLLGGGVMVAGLRPRHPLPPEPAGYSVERPLASRSEEEAGEAHADGERAARDTVVVRVRNDEPPSR